MCKKHPLPVAPKPTGSESRSLRRKKIWEIDSDMHCSIIGTCLSLRDLDNIARHAGVQFSRKTTEYDIHRMFVEFAGEEGPTAELIDRALERRHRAVTARIRKATSLCELSKLWDAAMDRGQEVAGAYWAIVSHPLLDEELKTKIFSQVHMLSHELGATRRVDIRRSQRLETASATLTTKLAQTKSVYRQRLKNRDQVIGELSNRVNGLEKVARQLTAANDRIWQLREAKRQPTLEARIDALEQAVREEQIRVERSKETAVAAEASLKQEILQSAHLRGQVNGLSDENAALVQELRSLLVCPSGEISRSEDRRNGVGGLCGFKTMMLGGHSNLVRHYRALIEQKGGQLIHHLADIGPSVDQFKRKLSRIDAVICPLDCIGHDESQSVREACKHMAKQFIPLRSAGLSSFARGIQAIH